MNKKPWCALLLALCVLFLASCGEGQAMVDETFQYAEELNAKSDLNGYQLLQDMDGYHIGPRGTYGDGDFKGGVGHYPYDAELYRLTEVLIYRDMPGNVFGVGLGSSIVDARTALQAEGYVEIAKTDKRLGHLINDEMTFIFTKGDIFVLFKTEKNTATPNENIKRISVVVSDPAEPSAGDRTW